MSCQFKIVRNNEILLPCVKASNLTLQLAEFQLKLKWYYDQHFELGRNQVTNPSQTYSEKRWLTYYAFLIAYVVNVSARQRIFCVKSNSIKLKKILLIVFTSGNIPRFSWNNSFKVLLGALFSPSLSLKFEFYISAPFPWEHKKTTDIKLESKLEWGYLSMSNIFNLLFTNAIKLKKPIWENTFSRRIVLMYDCRFWAAAGPKPWLKMLFK